MPFGRYTGRRSTYVYIYGIGAESLAIDGVFTDTSWRQGVRLWDAQITNRLSHENGGQG